MGRVLGKYAIGRMATPLSEPDEYPFLEHLWYQTDHRIVIAVAVKSEDIEELLQRCTSAPEGEDE